MEQLYPSSSDMITAWKNEELPMLREKDFRDDAERMAFNAFLDGWARGLHNKSEGTNLKLEEAAKEFATKEFRRPYSDTPDEPVIIVEPDRYEGFCAGAEWQKIRDNDLQITAVLETLTAGKEEIMKNAIDGIVFAGKDGEQYIQIIVGNWKDSLPEKVKLVILKDNG